MRSTSVRTRLAALSLGALLATGLLAACGERDKGTVTDVQILHDKRGDGGVTRRLVVKLDAGGTEVDGPYLTLKGIGSCKVKSRWPSCLSK